MANRKLRRKTLNGVKTRRSMYRKKNSKANRRGLAFASRKSRRQAKRVTRRAARRTRRQRGGDYLEGLSRPFFASVYPNTLQTTYAAATGAQPNNYPGNPAPENMTADHSWSYIRNGTIIPPDLVSKINTGFTLMAGNMPYSPTPLMAPGAGVSSGTAVVPSATAAASTGAAGAGAAVNQTGIAINLARGIQATQTF